MAYELGEGRHPCELRSSPGPNRRRKITSTNCGGVRGRAGRELLVRGVPPSSAPARPARRCAERSPSSSTGFARPLHHRHDPRRRTGGYVPSTARRVRRCAHVIEALADHGGTRGVGKQIAERDTRRARRWPALPRLGGPLRFLANDGLSPASAGGFFLVPSIRTEHAEPPFTASTRAASPPSFRSSRSVAFTMPGCVDPHHRRRDPPPNPGPGRRAVGRAATKIPSITFSRRMPQVRNVRGRPGAGGGEGDAPRHPATTAPKYVDPPAATERRPSS